MDTKNYILDISIETKFTNKLELTPLLDGINIKKDGSGYLIPRYFDSRKKVKFLCDFHGWIGTKPYDYGYPISQNMEAILRKFKIIDNFIETKILFKEQEYVYFVWELNSIFFESFVDFSLSTFCEWDEMKKIGSEVFKFNNEEELTDAVIEKEWWDWGFERAVMKPEFKEIDCMAMPYSYGVLISEPLKNALEEAQLTGFEITPFPVEFEYL